MAELGVLPSHLDSVWLRAELWAIRLKSLPTLTLPPSLSRHTLQQTAGVGRALARVVLTIWHSPLVTGMAKLGKQSHRALVLLAAC